MSEKLKRLGGGYLCLAHSSIVSGDNGVCERVEGDLPPSLDDDEMECGPIADEIYYVWPDKETTA
jgi:hypothetical protein